MQAATNSLAWYDSEERVQAFADWLYDHELWDQRDVDYVRSKPWKFSDIFLSFLLWEQSHGIR